MAAGAANAASRARTSTCGGAVHGHLGLASTHTGSRLAHTDARLTAAGKPAKVAIVACMQKYLRWLNAITRERASYAPPAIASA
ncbi:hypothetical protein [Xanthomonas translucens]|uniref:hypothetical protein n=1 Tax=Xanthomonas campestris pv. translucens TaxID=343 RepID=UPI000A68FFC0|nr:hypothetical protein [Xanthomonas translucens]